MIMDLSKIFALVVLVVVTDETVAIKCTEASTEIACVKVLQQAQAMNEATVCKDPVDFKQCETTVGINSKPPCLKCEPMVGKQFKPSCLESCFEKSLKWSLATTTTTTPKATTTAKSETTTTTKSETTTTKSETTTTKSETTTTKSETTTTKSATPEKPAEDDNDDENGNMDGAGAKSDSSKVGSDVGSGVGSGVGSDMGGSVVSGSDGVSARHATVKERMRRDKAADTNCYKACSTDAPKANVPNSNNSTGADAAFNVGQTLSFARIIFTSLALVMAVKVIAA